MVFARNVGDFIAQGVVAVNRLDELLQAPLGILGVEEVAQPLRDRPVKFEDNPPRRLKTAVDKNGADQGLKGVLERRGPRAAAAGFLAGPKPEGAIEPDLPRDLHQ